MSPTPEIIQQTFTEEIYTIPGKVVVITPKKWSSMEAKEIELLGKILHAVKLDIYGVQLIHSPTCKVDDLNSLSPKAIISFGSEVDPSIPFYEVTRINDVPVLNSHALKSFDEAQKKRLWSALQEMFTSPV